MDDQQKFIKDRKKNEIVEIITTYISRDIHFHTSHIECMNIVSNMSKTILELVHNDLCSLNKPSLASARYILTFIDDFSRYAWVYLSKNRVMSLKSSRNLGHSLKINAINP
jgi:hypothetical protein